MNVKPYKTLDIYNEKHYYEFESNDNQWAQSDLPVKERYVQSAPSRRRNISTTNWAVKSSIHITDYDRRKRSMLELDIITHSDFQTKRSK